MSNGTQIPLGKKFSEMPDDFRQAAHRYFYNILPLMSKESSAVLELGVEPNLEAFEGLIEEGGVQLRDNEIGGYNVILFNLVTQRYEDVTYLREDLEELV